MGIFQKLSTLIKSNINDLISRAENPEESDRIDRVPWTNRHRPGYHR